MKKKICKCRQSIREKKKMGKGKRKEKVSSRKFKMMKKADGGKKEVSGSPKKEEKEGKVQSSTKEDQTTQVLLDLMSRRMENKKRDSSIRLQDQCRILKD